MSSFKKYFTYDCISFSLLMLIYSVLGLVNYFPQPNTFTVFQLFAMTSCAVILMYFTDQYFDKSLLQRAAVDIMDTLFAVFVLGFAFGMFSFSWKIVISITIMVFAIYFGVFGITLINNQADAASMNKKIRKIRNRSNQE